MIMETNRFFATLPSSISENGSQVTDSTEMFFYDYGGTQKTEEDDTRAVREK